MTEVLYVLKKKKRITVLLNGLVYLMFNEPMCVWELELTILFM